MISRIKILHQINVNHNFQLIEPLGFKATNFKNLNKMRELNRRFMFNV